MNSLAPSFFIGSSSYLQVTKIFITFRSSSKFGQIRLRTAELAALEKSHRLIMGKSCEHSSSFISYQIIFILAGNKDMHESLDDFKFRLDTTTNSRVI